MIPFPKSPTVTEPVATAAQSVAEKSPEAAETAKPSPEVKSATDVLREAPGDRDRKTDPPPANGPSSVEGDAKPADKAESDTVVGDGTKTPATAKNDNPADSGTKKSSSVTPATETAETPVTSQKTEMGKEPVKAGATTAVLKAVGREEIKRRDDLKRDRKESLSTHLSEEARAFFSDHALNAAYKNAHDTFEDLAPSADEHPHDAARTRRWMAITGALLVTIVAVVAGFSLYGYMGVQETNLASPPAAADSRPAPSQPEAPSPAQPAQPETTQPESAPTPTVAATESSDASVQSAPEVGQPTAALPTEPTVAVADSGAVPPSPEVPPEPSGPTPAAAPSADAQALLATARHTRGPWAQRLAAYDAYFAAAPTDDRTMATLSFSLAEASRWADAARVAERAVTANPRNAQAWFVLAASRLQTNDREGAHQARTQCISLGGRWATECRAMH